MANVEEVKAGMQLADRYIGEGVEGVPGAQVVLAEIDTKVKNELPFLSEADAIRDIAQKPTAEVPKHLVEAANRLGVLGGVAQGLGIEALAGAFGSGDAGYRAATQGAGENHPILAKLFGSLGAMETGTRTLDEGRAALVTEVGTQVGALVVAADEVTRIHATGDVEALKDYIHAETAARADEVTNKVEPLRAGLEQPTADTMAASHAAITHSGEYQAIL